MSGGVNGAADQPFEREKVCYEQNSQQFRALNQTMWQVPLTAMTITGGLWYATFNLAGVHDLKIPLLALASVLDIGLVWVLYRVRYVMGQYLDAMKAFHPAAFVDAPGTNWFNGRFTVAFVFMSTLLLAAFAPLLAFYTPAAFGF